MAAGAVAQALEGSVQRRQVDEGLGGRSHNEAGLVVRESPLQHEAHLQEAASGKRSQHGAGCCQEASKTRTTQLRHKVLIGCRQAKLQTILSSLPFQSVSTEGLDGVGQEHEVHQSAQVEAKRQVLWGARWASEPKCCKRAGKVALPGGPQYESSRNVLQGASQQQGRTVCDSNAGRSLQVAASATTPSRHMHAAFCCKTCHVQVAPDE